VSPPVEPPLPDHAQVCVVGSANLDLVAGVARRPGPGETLLGHSYAEHPGGKGLNQAVAAARQGASTTFVGAVGADAAGERLTAVLTEAGCDVDAVLVVDTPTGRALIVVDDAGENSIVVIPGANDYCPTAHTPQGVLLVQLEVPMDVVAASVRAAKNAGCTVVLNPAPARDVPAEVLAAVDVIVPNEHEVELLGGVARLLDAGVGVVVVTRGADGAEVHRRDAAPIQIAAPAVTVVDTTGAGDTLSGTVAAALASGYDIDDAVRRGVIAGSLATTIAGAVPSIPTAAAVDALTP